MKLCLRPVLLLMVLPLALGGCDRNFFWNQKLTVTVETPSGKISGYAVQGVRIAKAKSAPAGWSARSSCNPRAEAVVLDLGKTPKGPRYLFALLGGVCDMLTGTLHPKMGTRWIEALEAAEAVKPGTIIPLAAKRYPLLVTFDDITKPETVKRVDPDDLDGAFGCRRNADQAPWRQGDLTYEKWVEAETYRLAIERAGERAGISGRANEALVERARILRPSYGPNAEERVRIEMLGTMYTKRQFDGWRAARRVLTKEIPATLPKLPKNPCYSLKSITLEITDEPVTEGQVEKVLGWITTAGFIIPPIRDGDPLNRPDLYNVRPSHFIDGSTLRDKREGAKK